MKIVLTVLFPLLTLGAIVSAVWYVPFRMIRLLEIKRPRWLYLGSVAAMVLALTCMTGLGASSGWALGLLVTAAGLYFGLFLFLVLSLVTLDVLGRFWPLPPKTVAWVAVTVAAGLTALAMWQAGQLTVNSVEVSIEGLESDVVVIHISDVHIGQTRGGAHLERIVTATNAANPDLVLINGDLVDGNSALEPEVLSTLGNIQAPTYFTTGNHESYVDTDRALRIIEGHGVTILHNEVVSTHGLQLVGLDYMNADENSFDMHQVNALTIKEELPKIPLDPSKPTLLMHHSPVGLEYVINAGVDLMVSGHTHAGQVFPATLLTPMIFPLNRGLYERGGTRFLVSQGAGTYSLRMRLGSANEIDLIRLTPAF